MSPAQVPSVAAAESREPVIQFAVLRSLGYRARMTLVGALAAVGLVLQVALASVLPGLPFLAAAVLLSWAVGYDNRLDRRGLKPDTAWTSVPFERISEIVRLDREMVRWDTSATDISSGKGAGMWILAGLAVVVAAAVVGTATEEGLGWVVAVDGFLLLLPQWFSGMRTLDRRSDLVLKAAHLDAVVGSERGRIEKTGKLSAQIRVAGGAARPAPQDARVAVSFPQAQGGLLSLQGQVVLNRVQGKPYPYFYAVVVAGRGLGLVDDAAALGEPPGIVVEISTEGDVDIAVVRQETTKTSGYHTDVPRSREILVAAVQIAEAQLARRGGAPAPSAA